MADIKRFTGFIAPDGTTHNSIKAATEHTKQLKVKEALQKSVFDTSVFYTTDRGDSVLSSESVADFLFNNREVIQQAFNQDVVMRAPRKKKSAEQTATAA